MKSRLLFALLLLIPGSLIAADTELVEQALQNMESERSREWAFTETTLTEGKTIVKSYDPQRPSGERWKLLTVNGREPTADEMKRIERQNRRDEEQQAEREADDSDESEISAMISPGSLSLIEENESRAIYKFKPGAESDRERKMMSHVDGVLEVDKAGPTVSSIELKSRGPFSPAFGVNISEFMTHMTFAPLEEGGPALPQTVAVRVEGRAFMVKKLNEDVKVAYSDWVRVTP
jgi:hypothetical protein